MAYRISRILNLQHGSVLHVGKRASQVATPESDRGGGEKAIFSNFAIPSSLDMRYRAFIVR
jgi:hypothetical protein